VRGIAPARKQLRSPLARGLAGFFGWLLAGFLLLPHAVLALVSLVPPFTWTAEFIPPVLNFGNWVALVSQSEHLRPMVNSLWMAVVATVAALALGFAAARFAAARKDRVGGLLEGMIAIPWAVPGTVFAVALATTFSANQPWLGRFVLIGTPWILPLAYLVRNLPLTGRAALAFITALGDFVVSIVLYTFDTRPISIEILSSLRLQNLGMAAAYGVLLMTASAAAFLLWGQGEGS